MESKLVTRIRDLGLGIGWKHPFLLPALAALTYRETDALPTMGVSLDGVVRVNPEWCGALPDEELQGVLCHEVMHLILMHVNRLEGRHLKRFNRAADRALNHVLQEMHIPLPRRALYPPRGQEHLNAEQLYELEEEQPSDSKEGGIPEVGAGCGVEPGDGDPASAEGAEEEWEKIAAQARAIAAGTVAGAAFGKLFERRQSIRWEQLIRSAVSRALATHGRDNQTWTRRSRRSPPGIILPGWKAERAVGAIIIDSSGSFSDQQFSSACDQVQRIAELAEARLYLVVHDSRVQFSAWINGKKRESLQAAFRGRGGTYFAPAYDELARVQGRFDFAVHLTDGEGDNPWPACPPNVRHLIVALVGEVSPSPSPPGATTVKIDI